jgi:hypothetical protein
MALHGWKQLIDGWPWFRGEGSFPVLPNSEFMPPLRFVRKPYGAFDHVAMALAEDDPFGWPITEYEEELMLKPGLKDIARRVLSHLVPLARGKDDHGISEFKLRDNPYWPAELAKRIPCLTHERFVLLLPLALSMTQNDRAYARWTLFGNSEQGPAHAFWMSFYTAPGQEIPAEHALDFFRGLLGRVYQEPARRLANLREAGFRVLPLGHSPQEHLPSWTADYLLGDGDSLRDVTYLLTFRPFRDLPAAVKRKYFAGNLHLLPFPGSLLFWGINRYHQLGKHLRLAEQIPLLHFVERHEFGCIRIPQSGWFEEAKEEGVVKASASKHGFLPVRNTYKRTYRQAREHRFEDHLVKAAEHRLPHVLFSTRPQDIDLYHKPMARNIQLWDDDYRPLLDGPVASAEEIYKAAEVVAEGGVFGYRFLFPAMCVGRHELYWHRPLVAYLDRRNRPTIVESAPLGYLTAYRSPAYGQAVTDPKKHDRGEMAPTTVVELWPRFLRREEHLENLALFQGLKEDPPRRTMNNVLKILGCCERQGHHPLTRSFARRLLTVDNNMTLEGWLRTLPRAVKESQRGRARDLVEHLRSSLESAEPAAYVGQVADLPGKRQVGNLPHAPPFTFQHTASRDFEEAYWNTISYLSCGQYVNKNNADCVRDHPTEKALKHFGRDLDEIGEYLLEYYATLVTARGLSDVVQVGELPFRWQTQYPFPWMGGWLQNQQDKAYERNILVKIPGRDRSQAVIMADHYDTAYMHDCYEKCLGGTGARLAAAGADDNCSATAALMLGAQAFLDLSRQGKLACDVWLLHLTGEEYPAEGLGASRMCQWLVEGTLPLHEKTGARHDQPAVRVKGLYVLDMIAHNSSKGRDTFQIAPGNSRESLWLAYQAHLANEAWNRSAEVGNRQPARRQARRGRRSKDGHTMPPLARFLPLTGEVRPHYDPRSTLFNTDGQAFSDVGVPVVLFMENYDIDRVGYHDTHDTMALINLDYGAALAAIAIESVARAAVEEGPKLGGA